MYKSNKILFLILIISIFILSGHSYTLEKYDYGEFFQIASGPNIDEKFQVSKNQLLKFKLKKDKSDSSAALFSITSDDAQEKIIFYSIFRDEIASIKNSNETKCDTPLEYSLCLSNVFSFTVQMDNYLFGGDLKISIQGSPDDSECYRESPRDKESSNTVSVPIYGTLTELPLIQQEVIKTNYKQTSGASTSFVNGVLIFSMVVLLSLQLIY
ncbi:hypothetical protein DICPUDRAFT_91181 [Dictyostelium purpureum]|uniref:Transmembrane protein n=1 Tax=Dictyostelium purpureum TaxID=5786 RepID=F0Z8N9_DICPU|nr:uncharacterized protein DICPUDRAFT_91181 [Dictyostelium purpureum]EGC39689.1 hypothetical protein DICPUDRAFT_91181 [Dictyostelium purpureum]|eukprot:XP_003283798.1 hypothetical protein DICPUDRAFT_91181 [Dictyostelium purpureum]